MGPRVKLNDSIHFAAASCGVWGSVKEFFGYRYDPAAWADELGQSFIVGRCHSFLA